MSISTRSHLQYQFPSEGIPCGSCVSYVKGASGADADMQEINANLVAGRGTADAIFSICSAGSVAAVQKASDILGVNPFVDTRANSARSIGKPRWPATLSTEARS